MEAHISEKIDWSQDFGAVLEQFYDAAGISPADFLGFGEILPKIEGGRVAYDRYGVRIHSVANATEFDVWKEWHERNKAHNAP